MLGGERAAVTTGGHDRGGVDEFADAAVADELDGEAELRIAALLAAGLEDALGFASRL